VLTFEVAAPLSEGHFPVVGEIINATAKTFRPMERLYSDPKDRESAVRRFGGMPQTGLAAALIGVPTTLRDMFRSLAPPRAEWAGRGAVPISLLVSPVTGSFCSFSETEILGLHRLSTCTSRACHLSREFATDSVFEDGRENLRFCGSEKGVGCWIKAFDDEEFVTSGQFEQRFFEVYLPLVLQCGWLVRTADELSVRLFSAPYGPWESVLQRGELICRLGGVDYPSSEPFHNRFLVWYRERLGLQDRLSDLRENLDRAATPAGIDRRAAAPLVASEEPPGSILERVDLSSDWFKGEGDGRLPSYCLGTLPHELRTFEVDSELVSRIVEGCAGFVSRLAVQRRDDCGSQEALGKRLAALKSEIDTGDAALAAHRFLVKSLLPWAPDVWWDDFGSCRNFHAALKTVIGAHCSAVEPLGRPLSVAGAYLVLCHGTWRRGGQGMLTPLLIESWSGIDDPAAPFLPRQLPAEARESLELLERLAFDLFGRSSVEGLATNVEEAGFRPGSGGRVFTVCMDDDFDVNALSRTVNTTVGRLLRDDVAEVPPLGSVTATIIRLHLSLLRRTSGVGPAGRLVFGDGVFELHAGS
jgi:hypothetical protein